LDVLKKLSFFVKGKLNSHKKNPYLFKQGISKLKFLNDLAATIP